MKKQDKLKKPVTSPQVVNISHCDFAVKGAHWDAKFIASAPTIIDQLIRQNEVMKEALENIKKHQAIIGGSSSTVSATSLIADKALKEVERIENA